jgi:hypothetical protein
MQVARKRMSSHRLRVVAFMACVAFVVCGVGGCYAELEGMPPPEYADGYAPVYYDGYVVDFDDGGRPYYYVDGARTFVPQTAPVYVDLVAHYHSSQPAYRRWSAHQGERYHGYRYHGHKR